MILVDDHVLYETKPENDTGSDLGKSKRLDHMATIPLTVGTRKIEIAV